jgi:hypothetical protein
MLGVTRVLPGEGLSTRSFAFGLALARAATVAVDLARAATVAVAFEAAFEVDPR